MREVSFTVAGLPPAKNEALSMLGVGHGHAERVRALLVAAPQGGRRQLHDDDPRNCDWTESRLVPFEEVAR